jgi:hypothetical protein
MVDLRGGGEIELQVEETPARRRARGDIDDLQGRIFALQKVAFGEPRGGLSG